MDNAIQILGGGLMALGLIISLVGYVRSKLKKSPKMYWGHWLVGMGVLGVGILILEMTGFYAG